MFRRHFGTLPWRDAEADQPLTLACQNFKGGVGKSDDLREFRALLGAQRLPGAG